MRRTIPLLQLKTLLYKIKPNVSPSSELLDTVKYFVVIVNLLTSVKQIASEIKRFSYKIIFIKADLNPKFVIQSFETEHIPGLESTKIWQQNVKTTKTVFPRLGVVTK